MATKAPVKKPVPKKTLTPMQNFAANAQKTSQSIADAQRNISKSKDMAAGVDATIAANVADATKAANDAAKSIDEANAAMSSPNSGIEGSFTAIPGGTGGAGSAGSAGGGGSGGTDKNYLAAGQVIGTRKGQDGFRIDLLADGKGGYTEGNPVADASEQYGTSTVIPGSTGTSTTTPTRTLAEDTFANTYALIFGKGEASQPYVKQLYKLVGGFYKTGSDISDSLNLALREAYDNNALPDFTKRFTGLFSLRDKERAGQAVKVPTIAEFIKAESDMGDILRSAGMGDIATQDYLGQVIGQGKSVHDVAVAIETSFNAIDNAPKEVKDTLASQFPMLDRTTLAKALLMGKDGAAEVQKKINLATTITAAAQNKMTLSDAQQQMLATSGLSYGQQLQGLGNADLVGQRGQVLSDIYGKTVQGYGKDEAIADQFQGLASNLRAKTQLINRDTASWSGSSGVPNGAQRNAFSKSTAGQI